MAVNTLYEYYTGKGQKLPSVAERSKIYESSGLGTGYQGTAQQNTALLKSLSAATIADTKPIVPVNPVPDTSPEKLAAGVSAGQEQQKVAEQTTAERQLEQMKVDQQTYQNAQMMQGTDTNQTAVDTGIADLTTAMDKNVGRGASYTGLLAEAGVPETQKRLAELNTQIAQKKAMFDNAAIDVQGGTGLTTTIAGKTGLLRRQQATELGGLSAEALALQGNIEAAKQTAKDTVDMEYADIEANIANKKTLLELNYDKLTTSEKKRADELKYVLDQQQARVDEEKSNKLDATNILLKASENKAPDSVKNAIKLAIDKGDVAGAITAAGDYLSDSTDGMKFTTVGSTTDKYGNTVATYGFVDEANKKVYDLKGNDITTSPNTTVSPTEGSVSFRTNNPGNIKWTGADWQIALGATDSGIKATDGGSFAQFPSIEAGTDAQKQLLTSKNYANLTVDAAMKRWSNNGYGAEVSSIKADTLMKDLTPNQLDTLAQDMKKREGFYAPTSSTVPEDVNSNISNITGKPITEVERISRTFATRLQESSSIIDNLDEKFTGKYSGVASWLPSFLKNEDRKSLEQAQRNFVTALLRKESGAAISNEEFDNAKSQYFPEPGDTELILEQKAQNRKTVITGMMLSGGMIAPEDTALDDATAYEEYLKIINK